MPAGDILNSSEVRIGLKPGDTPRSNFGRHVLIWNSELTARRDDVARLRGDRPDLVRDRKDLWDRNPKVIGMAKYFVDSQLQRVPEGSSGIGVIDAGLNGAPQLMASFWADSLVSRMVGTKTPETEEMAQYLVTGGFAREWLARAAEGGYLPEDEIRNFVKILNVDSDFPEPRPFTGDEKVGKMLGLAPTAAPIPAGPGMGPEVFRVNPDDVERLLLDRLQEGGMKKTQEGEVVFSDLSIVTEAVTKLEGAEDTVTRERAKLFRSMANLLTDIGSGKRNEPKTHTNISIDREAMVLLEKQRGVMAAWKTMIELAGFNFGAATAEQIRNGEIPSGFINRAATLESLVTRISPSLVSEPGLKYLFNEYDDSGVFKKKRTFWDLKAGDMGDADGRWGYVHLLRAMMAGKMGKSDTSVEVQRAVAIGVGLMRHSRLIEQFAVDPDHPWVDTEMYRLMHPADMFRRRAIANHEAVKDASLAPYVKANKNDFAVRSVMGEYGRGASVSGTPYDWNELFFPPDWFGSWLFAKDVMNKEGANDMTPWDYVGRGVAPTADKFRPKNIWELENFRRQAAVALDSMVFEKVEPIDTGKKEAWADKIATDAANILKKMGVVNKFTDASDLPGKQETINRVVRVVAMSRMGGMSMDRGKLNMLEDKAVVIRYGLDELKFTFKFMMDDGSEKELPVKMYDTQFTQWVRNNGVPLPGDAAANAERIVLKWLEEDDLAHDVIRVLAQGLKDQASRDKVRQINFRKKVGIGPNPSWYGGLGTHSAKAWFEREAMANFDRNGLTRVWKRINELNFG